MSFQQVFKQWKRTTEAFQSLAAQAENAWSPYDKEVLGIVQGDLAEEQRVREGVYWL